MTLTSNLANWRNRKDCFPSEQIRMKSCCECRRKCSTRASKNLIWRSWNKKSFSKRRTKSLECKHSKSKNWFMPEHKFSETRSSKEILHSFRVLHQLLVQIGISVPWIMVILILQTGKSYKCRGNISFNMEEFCRSLSVQSRTTSKMANKACSTTIRIFQFTSQQSFPKSTSISHMTESQFLQIRSWSKMVFLWLLSMPVKVLKANFRINIILWVWIRPTDKSQRT